MVLKRRLCSLKQSYEMFRLSRQVYTEEEMLLASKHVSTDTMSAGIKRYWERATAKSA
jgi:hypothetical protein